MDPGRIIAAFPLYYSLCNLICLLYKLLFYKFLGLRPENFFYLLNT